MKVNGKSKTPITAAQAKKKDGESGGTQARASQQTSKKKLSGVKTAVLDRISDGILAFDAGMNYTYLNERAGELLGRSAQELIGKNLGEEYSGAGRTPFMDACQRALETQSLVWLNEYFPATDRWLEGRVYPSEDGVSVLFTEGGGQKAVEEDRYRILVESMQEAFFLADVLTDEQGRPQDYRIVDVNAAMEQLLGKSRTQILGQAIRELLPLTDRDVNLVRRIAAVGLGGEPFFIDEYSESMQRWFRSHFFSPQPGQVSGMSLDITESRQAGERIREISMFPEQNPNPVMRLTKEGGILYANEASGFLLTAWEEEQYQAESFLKLRERLEQTLETGSSQQIEIENGGQVFNCLLVPFAANGYVNIYFQNITERKQAEEALRAIVDQASAGIVRTDLQAGFTFVNQAFCDMLGYSETELSRLSIWDVTDREILEKNRRLFEHMLATGEGYQLEKRLIRRDGSTFWVSMGTSALRDADGRIRGATSIIVDISRRKRAEESLLDGARRSLFLSSLSDSIRSIENPSKIQVEAACLVGGHLRASRVAYVEVDPEDRFVIQDHYVDGVPEMEGEFSISDFVPQDQLLKFRAGRLFNTPDVKKDSRFHASQRSKLVDLSIQTQMIVPFARDGRVVAALLIQQSQPRAWKDAEVSLVEEAAERMQAAIERAQVEGRLHDSEKRFRILANAVPSIVWTSTPDGRLLYVNDRWYEFTGIPRQESTPSWMDLKLHPEDAPNFFREMQAIKRSRAEAVVEVRLQRHDGAYRWFQTRSVPTKDELGTVTAWHGVLTDIHDRVEKEAEQRKIIDSTPFMLARCSRDLRYLFVSRAYAEMIGTTPKQLIGRPIVEAMGEQGLETIQPYVDQVLQGQGVEFETRMSFKDFNTPFLHIVYTPEPDEKGNIVGWFASIVDLTERRRMEDSLREGERKFNIIFNKLPFTALLLRPEDNIIVDINEEFETVFGYTRQEVIGKTTSALGIDTDLEGRAYILAELQVNVAIRDMELQLHTRSLGPRNFLVNTDLVNIGRSTYVLQTAQDITERKRAEQELAEFARQQGALYRLADELSSVGSLEEMFNPVLDAIFSALQCDRASILLFDEQDVMSFVAWRGLSDAYRQATNGHSPWTHAEKNARPIGMEDIATADLSDSLRAVIQAEGIGSLAFIPLISRGNLIGKFMVYFNKPHTFEEAEIGLSQTIAHQLASHIERKRAAEELRQSRQRLSLTYHHAPIGIVETTLDGRFLEVNDEFCRMLGYPYDELSRLGIADVTHPDTLEREQALYQQLVDGTIPSYRMEKLFIRKDGGLLWGEVVRTMVHDEDGRPLYGIGGVLNVTERKQREEELRARTEEVDALMEVSPLSIFFAHNPECSLITANPAGYQLVEMPEESTGNVSRSAPEHERPTYRTFRNGVELEPEELPMQAAARLGMEIEEETLELRFENGMQKYIYAYAKPLFDAQGKTRGAIAAMLDITQRMQREEELRARTEEIETLMEVSPIGIMVAHDPECNHITGNPAANLILGLPQHADENLSNPVLAEKGQAHLVYRDGVELAVPDLPMQAAARLGVDVKDETLELRFEDGSKKYIYLYARPLFDTRNKTRGAIAAMLDVTERRRSEQALRESEERFSKAFRVSPDAVTISRLSDGRIMEINNSWSRLFGYEADEAAGKSSLELNLFANPEDRSRVVDLLKQQGSVHDFEVDVRQKSGEIRHALLAVESIEINDVECLISIMRDITERKQIEEALRESEQRSSAIVSQATAGIVRKDESGRLLFVNQAFCDMLGMSEAELKGRHIWELTHPEDVGENKRLYNRLIAEGIPFHLEKRLINKQGSVLWVNVSVSPVVDVSGKPNSAVSVYVDITGRKLAEKRLSLLVRVSELAREFEDPDELMYAVAQAVGEHFQARRTLFNEIDLENNLEIIHRDYCIGVESVAGEHSLTGYSSLTTAEMTAGKTVVNRDSKLDPRTAADYVRSYVEHGERAYVTVPLMQDGRWVASLWLSDDKPRDWDREDVSLVQTIAERTWIAIEKMRVDRALRDSEERLRVTFNTTVVGFATLTPEGIFVDVNDAYCRIVGYSRQELLKLNSNLLTHPDFIEETRMHVAQLLAGEVSDFTLEKIYIRRDGTEIWVQDSVSIVRDENGEPLHLIAICQDITDRKRSEKALQESNQRYQTLVEISPYAIFVNKDGRIVFANNECVRLLGAKSLEQVIGRPNFDFLHPDYHDIVRERNALLMQGHQDVPSLEEKIIRFDGGIVDVEISASTFIEQGEPAILVTMNDITVRKRAEEALQQLNLELEERVRRRTIELQVANEFLRESEATSRLILESMPDAIVIIDRDGQIVHANTQVETLFGYSPGEVMGQPVETLVPQRFRTAHEQQRFSYGEERNRRIMGLGKELFGRRKDESEFPVEVMLAPIDNSTNWDVLVAIRDNTRQRQAQEALRINEEKLRTLFEILPVGISFLGRDGRVNELNSALAEILALPRRDILAGSFRARRFIRADGSPMPASEFASTRARVEQKTIYNVETGIVKEDGEIVWTSVNAAPVQVADVEAAVVTIDITERKKAEEALHRNRERLRTLSRRLVEVQEEERHAIARELHDRVGQNLAALTLNLNILRNQLSGEILDKIGTRLNDSVTLVNDILTITRSVMADLRPNVLDDYGLGAAVDEYAERFTQRYGIRVITHTPVKATPRLDPGVEMTLLRIAQEALTNIAKHAQASQAVMTLEMEDDAVLMTVEDNGQGIMSWQKVNQPGSHGLRIMRERAEAFGGSLKIHSTYKNGTRIEVKIPLASSVQANGRKEKK